MSAQPSGAAGQPVLGDVVAVALSIAIEPGVRPVVDVDDALAALAAAADERVARAPAAGACRWARAAFQPSFLPDDEALDRAVLEGEQVAVDEQRASCCRRAAVASQSVDACPENRRRRGRASRPGSAVPTGRRRTGCRGRALASCRNVPIATMSSPHEPRRWTRILVTVPLPLAFGGRQRHSAFFESRIERGRGPPTARKRGVATVAPRAFWPDSSGSRRLLVLRSTR